MDGSGDAIVAWTGGGKQIRTVSLPAGGNWTAVDTLDPAADGDTPGPSQRNERPCAQNSG